MKVRMPKKTYEYDQVMVVVNTPARNKLKLYAAQEKLSIKAFVEKLIDDYENTGN